ncbi:MAG: hypothetical protein R3227_05915 [Reinekea sp.]|nr:hypothetical protein [Reinekea sp.]
MPALSDNITGLTQVRCPVFVIKYLRERKLPESPGFVNHALQLKNTGIYTNASSAAVHPEQVTCPALLATLLFLDG